jgi:hypothetical protein
VKSLRRHLSAIGIAWLVFQAGVLAASPFISCCAAAEAAAVDDKCCDGLAPGQICPLHKHRQAPPKPVHEDGAHRDCAIRGGCATMDPALTALAFGHGVLDPPASLFATAVSHLAPQLAACTVDCAPSLDPPPPR